MLQPRLTILLWGWETFFRRSTSKAEEGPTTASRGSRSRSGRDVRARDVRARFHNPVSLLTSLNIPTVQTLRLSNYSSWTVIYCYLLKHLNFHNYSSRTVINCYLLTVQLGVTYVWIYTTMYCYENVLLASLTFSSFCCIKLPQDFDLNPCKIDWQNNIIVDCSLNVLTNLRDHSLSWKHLKAIALASQRFSGSGNSFTGTVSPDCILSRTSPRMVWYTGSRVTPMHLHNFGGVFLH